jgi:PAS domain S-box-containing protein
MRRLARIFQNFPIGRKLLLTSTIPTIALALLSLVVYRSVRTFADDQEQLNNVYLVQRTAAEYMRLVVDLETGFRGFVLTKQVGYLNPYRVAHDHILTVGDSLKDMVQGRSSQQEYVQEVQGLIRRLMSEKDELLQAIRDGHSVDALHYLEQGRGRALMLLIREKMDQFDRLELSALNDALEKIAQDRSLMIMHIMGGIVFALALMVFALHLIARSITGPLVTLAKSVRSSTGLMPPDVPVLARRDEIGELTRVMSAMSTQLRAHLTQMEQSEGELRTLNQHLAASESKYRSIVDHAPLGIFTTKGMAMTFINRHNRVLAGLDPDQEVDPEVIRQLMHPEDRDRVLTEFAKAVEENRPYETVFRFLHRDGTVRKVLSRRIPIRDEEGRTVMYQGFNIDITALDQMQARLSRVERLATLGQVAAGIAHEIRNPLVGIGSTASLLLDDTEPADLRRADLEVILSETRRLDRIVNQIIDYARPRVLAPVLFALNDVIQEALKLLDAPIAGKKIQVTCALHPTLSQLQADRDQVKQVLLNVFQNAVEAMGEGGALTITAFETRRDQDPGMTLSVTDNGTGIAPHDLTRVFEPFFTIGKRRGTGLGLAICRNIIDAHYGDIQLASQPGLRTTVRIWLPLRPHPRITPSDL